MSFLDEVITDPTKIGPRQRKTATHMPRKIEFLGSGKDYFPLWFKNLFLTIITFGIYSPWAKVSRLKYFARNTMIDGYPLEYHGEPIRLLIGRLVALIFLLFYNIATNFGTVPALVALALFALAYPWLVQQSMKFRLRNTSYRGLRFNFSPSTFETYFSLFMAPVVFSIIFPLSPLISKFWHEFRFNNASYAGHRFGLNIPTGTMYGIFFRVVGVSIVFLVLGFTGVYSGEIMNIAIAAKYSDSLFDKVLTGFLIVLLGAGFIAATSLTTSYYKALLHRAVWDNVSLGPVTFRSVISPWLFVMISVSNQLLSVISLGIFRPFAQVWSYKYRLNSILLQSELPWDQLVAESTAERNVIGEEAADLFDIDIGL